MLFSLFVLRFEAVCRETELRSMLRDDSFNLGRTCLCRRAGVLRASVPLPTSPTRSPAPPRGSTAPCLLRISIVVRQEDDPRILPGRTQSYGFDMAHTGPSLQSRVPFNFIRLEIKTYAAARSNASGPAPAARQPVPLMSGRGPRTVGPPLCRGPNGRSPTYPPSSADIHQILL